MQVLAHLWKNMLLVCSPISIGFSVVNTDGGIGISPTEVVPYISGKLFPCLTFYFPGLFSL